MGLGVRKGIAHKEFTEHSRLSILIVKLASKRTFFLQKTGFPMGDSQMWMGKEIKFTFITYTAPTNMFRICHLTHFSKEVRCFSYCIKNALDTLEDQVASSHKESLSSGLRDVAWLCSLHVGSNCGTRLPLTGSSQCSTLVLAQHSAGSQEDGVAVCARRNSPHHISARFI